MSRLSFLWRLELVRLLRMGEVYRYLLLPTLFAVPMVVALVTLYQGLIHHRPVVTLPADLPSELPLADELERQGLDWRVMRALGEPMEGSADAVVVGWWTGDGIQAVHPELEAATPWRWRLDVRATDPAIRQPLGRAIRQAGNRVLEEEVVLAGGEPDAQLWFARVRLEGWPGDGPWYQAPGLWVAYAIFVLGTLAYQLLVVPGVADRRAGVLESLLATPTPVHQVLLARVLAVLALQAMAVSLLVASLYLFTWGLLGQVLDAPSPAAVVAAVVGVLLVDCLYLAVGMAAPSLKTATNAGTAVMLLVVALLLAGAFGRLPFWLPLAGLARARGGFQTGVASGVSLLAAGLLLVLLSWGMRRLATLEPVGGGP